MVKTYASRLPRPDGRLMLTRQQLKTMLHEAGVDGLAYRPMTVSYNNEADRVFTDYTSLDLEYHETDENAPVRYKVFSYVMPMPEGDGFIKMIREPANVSLAFLEVKGDECRLTVPAGAPTYPYKIDVEDPPYGDDGLGFVSGMLFTKSHHVKTESDRQVEGTMSSGERGPVMYWSRNGKRE